MKNILVALNGRGSDKSLDLALSIAKHSGAAVTGLVVVETGSGTEMKGSPDIDRKAEAEAGELLRRAEEAAGEEGVKFRPRLAHGNIGYTIVKHAHSGKTKYDMLVIGTRGRGLVKSVFFGSTSNRVLHYCKIPVLIAK